MEFKDRQTKKVGETVAVDSAARQRGREIGREKRHSEKNHERQTNSLRYISPRISYP